MFLARWIHVSDCWNWRVVFFCSVAALVTSAGCGDGRPPVYSVNGKITFANGKPVPDLGIALKSLDAKGNYKGLTARGSTEQDGSYTLTTFDASDGAVEGRHSVAIFNPVQVSGKDAEDIKVKSLPVINQRFEEYDTSGLSLIVSKNPSENVNKDFVVEPAGR